jgi:hypothetical protein
LYKSLSVFFIQSCSSESLAAMAPDLHITGDFPGPFND